METGQSPPRILIASPFHRAGVKRLQQAADVDLRPALRGEKLQASIGDYQALIVDSETPVPDHIIEYAYQLQVIGVAGASLLHLGVSAARAQGVEVIHIPDPRTIARAELTFNLLLNLAHRDGGGGLAGKTLGIVGFRDVGREVADRARAFQMRVLVHQPRLTPQLALEAGVELCELHEMLEVADFVSLHMPITAETRGLFGPNKLGHMRPESFLINTGGAEIINLPALEGALRAGKLAGAALVQQEDDLGFTHPRLLIVPRPETVHATAGREIALQLADKIIDRLQERRPENPLSLRVVPLERVLPHEHFDPERVNDLAERLSTESTLVNPPLVVEWGDCYVVLDGATRTTAFQQLGYPHIVVQLVSPEDERLTLHTWYHAVSGRTTAELVAHLQTVESCQLVEAPSAKLQSAVDSGQALCSLIKPDGTGYVVAEAGGASLLQALNDLVAAYTEIGSITRTLNTDLRTLQAEVPDVALLVIFPQFTLLRVLDAAVSGELLPAGITRFLIPGRVLRLHAALDKLRADESLAKKNVWLNKLLADKMARRRVRFYQEPVILLDE